MRPHRVVPLLALGVLMLAGAVLADKEAPTGWRAYFQKKGDKQEEFPADKKERAKIKDEKWLAIAYTEYTGYKPRVGVFPDEIEAANQPEYQNEVLRFFNAWGHKGEQGGPSPFEEVEGMVRQALGATNRFTMVERTTATKDVLDEQDFGASGRVDKKTSAPTGAMKGAEYNVKVKLLEFNPEKESKSIKMVGGGIGASTIGVGSYGASGTVAYCRLNVRVIETATGTIVQDMTVDGTSKSKSGGFGLGALKGLTGGLVGGALHMDSETQASLTEAIQVAANKIAYHGATRFQDLPWRGRVAEVDGATFYINAGTNVGLTEGLTLKIQSRGKEVHDPDTGEVIDVIVTDNGSARITKVMPKMATCQVVARGDSLVKIGDFVLREKDGK